MTSRTVAHFSAWLLLALAMLSYGCSSSPEREGSGSSGGAAGAVNADPGGAAATSGGSTATSGATGAGGSEGGAHDGGNPGDRPYANVTKVVATGTSGDYRLNVSIESADIDCSQYADWWEVLSADGSLLYRRILEHSHTDENGTSDPDAPGNTFTRDGGPVPISDSGVCIVRAHMSNGGYNGMAMRGTALDGFEPAPDIDAAFAADVEHADPQPSGCEF